MSFINKLKDMGRRYKRSRTIKMEYKCDMKAYIQYNYNNPKLKSQHALEAKILRQAHMLEKGMSLSHPKDKFGVDKAMTLLGFVDEYKQCGYSENDAKVIHNALGTVYAYIEFHKERGFSPEKVIAYYEELAMKLSDEERGGTSNITMDQMNKEIHSEFPEFFHSRHSIRQFASSEVDVDAVKEAVRLAMKAPSACNRQSCRVYFYKDKKVNADIGRLIAGNTGFEKEVQHYLVLTGDMSAFYDAFERNQLYIDAGIFTMALTEALHYYGIGSCILQNGELQEKNKKFRNICNNIPENERIVVFIAIGNYKDNITYAVSRRKNIDDVFIVK